MAVIKEWNCSSCGIVFESPFPICIRCGATESYVTRYFTQPPAFKGDVTKFKDESLQQFAKHYSLSDFTNNPNAKHEKNFDHLWKPVSNLVADPAMGSGGVNREVFNVASSEASKVVKNPHLEGRSK